MDSSPRHLFRNLVILTLSLIVMTLPNKIMSKDSQEFYINPWSAIKRDQPQIITFDANGDAVAKNIPRNSLHSYKKMLEHVIKHRNGIVAFRSEDPYTWNMTQILEDMHKYIRNMQSVHQNQKKRKILTVCNESTTLCRFLYCQPEKRSCTLCETKLSLSPKTATQCIDVSTAHLYDHRHNY